MLSRVPFSASDVLHNCESFVKGFFGANLFGWSFIVAFLAFRHLARFDVIQSLLLAFITAAVAVAFRSVRSLERAPFEPFYIRVNPGLQWFYLLKDNGVVDEDSWCDAYKSRIAKAKGYRILRDGIAVTVLGPQLYYSHNHHSFSKKLDVWEPLKGLRQRVPLSNGNELSFTPKFYMKLTSIKHPKYGRIRCIEFGLHTAESLSHSDWPDDRGIPVAVLPDALFNGYYGDHNFSLNKKLNERDVAALLVEYGWNDEDHDPYDLRHKYVKISYRGI